MTVETIGVFARHDAVEGQDTYTYDFLILEKVDMTIFLGNERYLGEYNITGLGEQQGGEVILDVPITPEEAGKTLSLIRIIHMTQDTDYTAYDAFPAESHERALDKLTMLNQQNLHFIANSINIPFSESPLEYGTTVPLVDIRKGKFLAFDDLGNIVVVDGDPIGAGVREIHVQDGSGGEDSRNLLHVDVITNGSQYPMIGFKNINKPNGPVQLNEQGKVPPELINFSGVTILGPIRGDDLCDKQGDEPGDCVEPDYRNPSQRDPTRTFNDSDLFIITIEPTEVNGSMLLFDSVGDPTPSDLIVERGDGIIFLDEREEGGTVQSQEGWYIIRGLITAGDAASIVYDDSGNIYVIGNNVQSSLDSIDAEFIKRDAYYLTEKDPFRTALYVLDANTIVNSGLYAFNITTQHKPRAESTNMSCVHVTINEQEMTQTVTDLAGDGRIWTRVYHDGSWSQWLLILFGEETMPHGAFTVSGDRLDIDLDFIPPTH